MRETGKRRWAAPAVLGAAFLLAALCIPSFRHPKIYLTILKNGAYNGIMALGLLFVLLCGEIDLSVSAQLSFFGVLCAVLLKKGVPVLLAALVMLAAAVLVGFLMGAAVGRLRVNSVIATIALGVALEGLTYILADGMPVYNLPEQFTALASWKPLRLSQPTIAWFLLALFTALVLRQTYWGRFFCAVGRNPLAAERAGVPVARTKEAAFALCSLYCGVCALVYTAQIGLAPLRDSSNAGVSVLAIAALGGVSFSGGRGRVVPVFCAALLLSGLSSAFIVLRVPSYYQNCIKGAIIFLAILTKIPGSKFCPP